MPFEQMHDWLAKEKSLGSAAPDRIVLATANTNGVPHSRIVAIREMNASGILFFTQRGTRKTYEIAENPQASMTLWLPLQQREVMVDGVIETLSAEENQSYWLTRSKERQLHFMAYSPTSSQVISSTQVLEKKLIDLTAQYENKTVPMPDSYLGYRLVPQTYVFYTLIDAGFSAIVRWSKGHDGWRQEVLSP